MSQGPPSRSMVAFCITSDLSETNSCSGPYWDVEAVVLPRIMTELPTSPVPFDIHWKHLSYLRLADPEFGVPGHVDILLGVDMFNRVVLHGWQNGPPGSPSAFETQFGWVLSRMTSLKHFRPQQVVSCFALAATEVEVLHKFWEVENCEFQPPTYSPEKQAVMDHFLQHIIGTEKAGMLSTYQGNLMHVH